MHESRYDPELVDELRRFVRQHGEELAAREFLTIEEKVGFLLAQTNLPWAANPVQSFWPDQAKVEILRHLVS